MECPCQVPRAFWDGRAVKRIALFPSPSPSSPGQMHEPDQYSSSIQLGPLSRCCHALFSTTLSRSGTSRDKSVPSTGSNVTLRANHICGFPDKQHSQWSLHFCYNARNCFGKRGLYDTTCRFNPLWSCNWVDDIIIWVRLNARCHK